MWAVSHDKPLGLQKNVHENSHCLFFLKFPIKCQYLWRGSWTPEVGDLPGWFRSLKSWSASIKWGFTVHKYNDKSVKIHFCSWKTIGTKVLFMNSSRAAISFRQKSILAMRSGFLLPFVSWGATSWRCAGRGRNQTLGHLTSDEYKGMEGKHGVR